MLSEKLALLEASESLSEAAATLSAAAQSMSKAAKSLAMASSYLAEGGAPQTAYTLSDYHYSTSDDSSLWQQPEYHLPIAQGTPDNSDRRQLAVTSQKAEGLHTFAQHGSLTSDALAPPPAGVLQHQDSTYDISNNQPVPPASSDANSVQFQPINEKKPEDINVGKNLPHGSDVNTSIPDTLITPDKAPAKPLSNTPTSAHSAIAAIPELPASVTPHNASSSVVLDKGSDEIPALCFLSQIKPKTICFYRYWGSAFVVGSCLKKNVDHPIIVPASLKPDKRLEAAKTFEASSAGILLWPFHVELPKIRSLESDLNTQVIHLGKPSGKNADVEGTQVIVVLARTELMELSTHERETFLSKYSINENTSICNDQAKLSALHSARALSWSRLARLSTAREFYSGWFIYHRAHNPGWSPNELVNRANRYAEEFLLRGDSSTSKALVGGRVPLKAALVKSLKLESAVQSGLLLVG
ncbi:hypothetical protein BDV93DRAFT_557877 [Ceratobasidium sp. AG-I]|nr:hypothetical protein BDV93DRAFT_557877 [Ceratobasidium sp. AG-I]